MISLAKIRPKNIVLLSDSEAVYSAWPDITRGVPSEVDVLPVRPITIDEELYESLNFHQINSHEVAYINGTIERVGEQDQILKITSNESAPSERKLWLG
jgi:hypothetical protein